MSYVAYQNANHLHKVPKLGLGLVMGNNFVQNIFEERLVGVGICMPLVYTSSLYVIYIGTSMWE
jgi:hypothetical protein